MRFSPNMADQGRHDGNLPDLLTKTADVNAEEPCDPGEKRERRYLLNRLLKRSDAAAALQLDTKTSRSLG